MQSHVFGGSQVHDLLLQALGLYYIMHYKCIVIIVLHIFRNFLLFILCLIVNNMHNVTWFAAI